MGKITGYATVGMVLALAKKMAIQYGALGIADVRTTPDGSDLIFIMSDGSQHRVELNFSANGVDYDDSVTKFNVNNVQAAIEALFSELQAKQNTLTAGNGISIENDTISVTDAGGLTVLPYGNLDADTLAKVKANPQNYCIYNSVSTDKHLCYFISESNTFLYYILTPFQTGNLSGSAHITNQTVTINKNTGAVGLYGYEKGIIFHQDTFKTTFGVSDPIVRVIGVQDTTDNSIKTGTEIRKAITIRKWH